MAAATKASLITWALRASVLLTDTGSAGCRGK